MGSIFVKGAQLADGVLTLLVDMEKGHFESRLVEVDMETWGRIVNLALGLPICAQGYNHVGSRGSNSKIPDMEFAGRWTADLGVTFDDDDDDDVALNSEESGKVTIK